MHPSALIQLTCELFLEAQAREDDFASTARDDPSEPWTEVDYRTPLRPKSNEHLGMVLSLRTLSIVSDLTRHILPRLGVSTLWK